MIIDLRFRWPREPSPGSVNLRFGDPGPIGLEPIVGTLVADLPSAIWPTLTFSGTATADQVVVVPCQIDAALGSPLEPTLTFSGTTQSVGAGDLWGWLPSPLWAELTAEIQATTEGGFLSAILPLPAEPILSAQLHLTTDVIRVLAILPPPPPHPVAAAVTAERILDLPDGCGRRARSGHQQSRVTARSIQPSWAQGRLVNRPLQARFAQGFTRGQTRPLVHAQAQSLERAVVAANAHGFLVEHNARAPHLETLRAHRSTEAPNAKALPLVRAITALHAETVKHERLVRTHQKKARQLARRTQAPHAQGLFASRASRSVSAHATWPPVGFWSPIGPEHPEPPPPPSDGLVLRFCRWADGTTHLRFLFCITPPTSIPVTVPIRRVYLVLNDVHLLRASDQTEVPCESLSLTLDVGSWTWGFNAQLPPQAEPWVTPVNGPVEVLAAVNGTVFRIRVEGLTRRRVFGQTQILIRGRGHHAVLDAPYAPVQTFSAPQDLIAPQLMDAVLTDNGVPLGWSIDWDLEPWLIPGGVWSHQGTYISALNTIARAAGATLQPHPEQMRFRVQHRYPIAPWDWASHTPEIILPATAVLQEAITVNDKPAYNRVFVSGESNGVLGQVTRTGSAGDRVAPMVVDALITEITAARQRGLAILADTGRQLEVQLRLPILPETGVITPGVFLEYAYDGTTRRGLVRATQIDVSVPQVWQTLELETRA